MDEDDVFFTPEEYADRFRQDPMLREVVVEAERDQRVLESYCAARGLSVIVRRVADIGVTDETVDELSLPKPSTRSQVLALSVILAKELTPDGIERVVCIADGDHDVVLSNWTPNAYLLFTDYPDIEGYLTEGTTLGRYAYFCFMPPIDLSACRESIAPALFVLFAARVALHSMNAGATWPVIRDKHFAVQPSGRVVFRLNSCGAIATLSRDKKETFWRTLSEIFRKGRKKWGADAVYRCKRGHDMAIAIRYYIVKVLKVVPNLIPKDPEALVTTMCAFISDDELSEYPLFQQVAARLSWP